MPTETKPTAQEIEERQHKIRRKRIGTIIGCYELLGEQFSDFKACTTLSNSLVAESVEKYLGDRERFVARNNIKGRIQRHKIAGLMTAAIAKTKPICVIDSENKDLRTSKVNEFFAVMHGIAICSEGYDPQVVAKMRGSQHFHLWFSDFVYLTKRHPDSADGFVLIFETLCLNFFPNVLGEP